MDPGLGYFKLWLMLKRMFLSDWVPGRDAFLSIMRQFGLMLSRPKPRHTTNSNHRYHKYRNLIRGYVPTASNQLWVSDITYIDLVDGCCYLHLVTEDYKPTDNAVAERVNGILKTEVIYREHRFKTIDDARERIALFINFYNDKHPHGSIGMKVPSLAHIESGPQRCLWKVPKRLSGAVCPLPQGTP